MSDRFSLPPQDFVQLHAAAPAAPVACPEGTRGLLVGTAGTLNVTMTGGVERTGVPFPAGFTPGFFTVVRAGGTAQNIWAVR